MNEVLVSPFLWWPGSAIFMFLVGALGGLHVYFWVALIITIAFAILWSIVLLSQKQTNGLDLFTLFIASPSYVLGIFAGVQGALINRAFRG